MALEEECGDEPDCNGLESARIIRVLADARADEMTVEIATDGPHRGHRFSTYDA